MSEVQFNYVKSGEQENLTFVATVNGRAKLFPVDSNHPAFAGIKEAVLVQGNAARAVELYDAAVALTSKLKTLSERIAVRGDEILLDGDVLEDVYADHILRFLTEGVDDWEPLVKFLEKVFTNNEQHTRDNLSRWLTSTGGFTIDDDGDIIGYKGLTTEGGSIHHGPAVVDGEAVEGSVPNKPGSVITMARSEVEHNPRVGCATGLHVGTWSYASGFGHGVVAKVKVNPRDVVSVPTDCGGQKMRVSRYEVLEYVDEAHNTVVAPSNAQFTEDYIEGYEDGYEDAWSGNGYKLDD